MGGREERRELSLSQTEFKTVSLPVSVSSLSICVTLSKTEVDDLLQVFFLSTCFGEHHKGARALGTYCGYQVNQVVKLYRDWKLDKIMNHQHSYPNSQWQNQGLHWVMLGHSGSFWVFDSQLPLCVSSSG